MRSVVIVDAFSSGSALARRFFDRGFEVSHLVSSENLPEFLRKTKPQGIFKDEFLYQGPSAELRHWIAAAKPDCIVPGTETGVILADELAAAFALPGNNVAKSPARRDKYEMVQTLHDVGLDAAAHFKSSDLSSILDWVDGHGGFPKVVKPLHSAGSDGVTVCRSKEDCERSFREILKTTNRLGLMNTEVLVEEYLQGTEYMVNAVRCRGKTIVTDFGFSKRIVTSLGTLIYDGVEILACDDPAYAPLSAYLSRCLDALEIDYGAAHGEVMMTERGPVLIEVAARLPGGGVPAMVEATSSYSPLDAVIDSYCFPEEFDRRAEEGVCYSESAEMVFLISDREGRLARQLTAEDFTDLPSFTHLSWDLPPDGRLKVTKDLFDCPGHITLRHHDPAQIAKDHQAIREREKELYGRLLTGA